MPRFTEIASKLPGMKVSTHRSIVSSLAVLPLACLLAGGPSLQAQSPPPPGPRQVQQIVVEAVHAELAADQNDHSHWRYRDEQKQQDDSISIVVQTDNGAIRRLIAKYGRPLSPSETQTESARINNLIHDPALLAKQRKDGAQDDKSARELLNVLPTAFLWRIEGEGAE